MNFKTYSKCQHFHNLNESVRFLKNEPSCDLHTKQGRARLTRLCNELCSDSFHAHGVPKGVNLQKKLPGSDTYFFEKHIPLGIQKRPNENI